MLFSLIRKCIAYHWQFKLSITVQILAATWLQFIFCSWIAYTWKLTTNFVYFFYFIGSQTSLKSSISLTRLDSSPANGLNGNADQVCLGLFFLRIYFRLPTKCACLCGNTEILRTHDDPCLYINTTQTLPPLPPIPYPLLKESRRIYKDTQFLPCKLAFHISFPICFSCLLFPLCL